MSFRRALSLVLALVLCLQSGLAMAHGLRLVAPPAHQPFQVEICTAEGLVKLDLGGAEDGEGHREDGHAGFCLACLGVAVGALPAPGEVAAPLVAFTALAPWPAQASLPPGARAPPYRPTGPPSLS